jgi:single-strand DNA-binding protein
MGTFFRQSPVSWLPFAILGQMEGNIMSSIGVSKVILLGNASQDAEVKSTSAGKSVANFSLAISQPFYNKKDRHQRVEWVHCVAWDKLAQIAQKFVAKGTVVFVEGRLQTRKFEDRERGTKTVTEVVVASLRVLGGAKAWSRNDRNHDAAASSTTGAKSEAVPF